MVELMAVIVVIMLTVGMIIGGAGYLTRKAGIARAETEIAQIEAALEEFKSQFGAYPAQYFDVCNVLTGRNVDVTIASPSYTNSIPPVRPPRPFMPEFKSLDPFGQPYNYRGPGDANRRNKSSFDLWSNGPNRTTTAGGDDNNDPKDVDNIRNWK
jgi:type II secretory pathway pseudopilin PulG